MVISKHLLSVLKTEHDHLPFKEAPIKELNILLFTLIEDRIIRLVITIQMNTMTTYEIQPNWDNFLTNYCTDYYQQ